VTAEHVIADRPRDPLAEPSTELSSNRTAMSFERTAMSADRTLMSIMRTALSLISFGFTIYQFIGKLAESENHVATTASARNFGSSLVILGIGLLAAGLVSHGHSFIALRSRRRRLHGEGLIRTAASYNPTPTAIAAVLLLVLGVVAVVGMIVRLGPLR
jgi:putative membrane protein